MNGIRILTFLAFPLLLGLLIGGAISGDSGLLTWCIILLVLDVIVGVVTQHSVEKAMYNDDWNYLSFDEKRARAQKTIEKAKQEMSDEGINVDQEMEKLCDELNEEYKLGKYANEKNGCSKSRSKENELFMRFNAVYSQLKSSYGITITFKNIRTDKAGVLLLDICDQMSHAPQQYALFGLYEIFADNSCGFSSIVYKFLYNQHSICQNVYIYLVLNKDLNIRFFTVETHFSDFVLCEYSGNSHLNHGRVDLGSVPMRIKEILGI